MKKIIILFIALTAAINMKAENTKNDSYLFLNDTGSYDIAVKDIFGRVIEKIENKEVARIPKKERYLLAAFRDGNQVGRTIVFEPQNNQKNVMVVKFGRLFNRGIQVSQRTLEQAKKRYSKEIPYIE